MLQYDSYLTYQDYKELGGTLQENAFSALERKAQRELDYITFDRIKHCTIIPNEVRELLVEMIGRINDFQTQKQGGDLITQYSNGVEQFSYRITTEEDLKKEFYQLALKWLPDYLTCRGINFDVKKYLQSNNNYIE